MATLALVGSVLLALAAPWVGSYVAAKEVAQ